MTTETDTWPALTTGLPQEPYPGLRPFGQDEYRIFFGREEIIDKLIDALASNNLVVVHGASGSGKSSLIRAGVLPWLAIQQGGDRKWLTANFKPAGGPLRNFAALLADFLGAPAGFGGAPDATGFWHLRLALGTAALSDIEAALRELGASLCVLVDQFEDLFRYAREVSHEEAKILAQLLCFLASKENPAPHFFVIVTMRSDYLGECARFEGFAETVNACQYLLPGLNDFGILRAIHEPATLYGGKVEPPVGDRLLRLARREEDGLPILQHALMRAYVMARKRQGPGEAWAITPDDLTAIEGQEGALSHHADEVLAEFSKGDARRLWAVESLFRCITELNDEGRILRRPCRVKDLVAVADVDRETVIAAIQAFQGAGRSFLTSSPPGVLSDDTEIDVSHEAFIRGWTRISEPVHGWMSREFRSGLVWQALRVAAESFQLDPNEVLSSAAARERQDWLARCNAAWSKRYGGKWELVQRLIQVSLEKAEEEEQRKRAILVDAEKARSRVILLRWAGIGVAVAVGLALTAGIAAVSAVKESREAYAQSDLAAREAARARRQADIAEQERERAKAEASIAERERQRAVVDRQRAEEALDAARSANQRAAEIQQAAVDATTQALKRSGTSTLAALDRLLGSSDAFEVALLAQSLAQSSDTLSSAQVEALLDKLLKVLPASTDASARAAVSQALSTLAAKLTPDQAAAAFERVLRAAKEEKDRSALQALRLAGTALAVALPGEESQRALRAIDSVSGLLTPPAPSTKAASDIVDLDAKSEYARLRATQSLVSALRDGKAPPEEQRVLAATLIDMLTPDRIVNLTFDGQFNAAFVLNEIRDATWQQPGWTELSRTLRSNIQLLEARVAKDRIKVGIDTLKLLISLDRKLNGIVP